MEHQELLPCGRVPPGDQRGCHFHLVQYSSVPWGQQYLPLRGQAHPVRPEACHTVCGQGINKERWRLEPTRGRVELFHSGCSTQCQCKDRFFFFNITQPLILMCLSCCNYELGPLSGWNLPGNLSIWRRFSERPAENLKLLVTSSEWIVNIPNARKWFYLYQCLYISLSLHYQSFVRFQHLQKYFNWCPENMLLVFMNIPNPVSQASHKSPELINWKASFNWSNYSIKHENYVLWTTCYWKILRTFVVKSVDWAVI